MNTASRFMKGLNPATPSLWKIMKTVRPKKVKIPAIVAMSMRGSSP